MQVNPVALTPEVVPVVEKVVPVPQVAKTESGSGPRTGDDGRPSSEKLRALQAAMAKENIALKFRRDEATDQLVIELFDSETGDPIRQMPSEVSLRLEATFTKMMGQFVDELA